MVVAAVVDPEEDLAAQGAEALMRAAAAGFHADIREAFAFGVLPLAIATGASAASQNAIGTGVLGGMISATVLAVFFVPVFFVFVMTLFGRKKTEAASEAAD